MKLTVYQSDIFGRVLGRKTYLCIAAAAIAAAWIAYTDVAVVPTHRSNVAMHEPAISEVPQPIAFAQRFPAISDLQSNAPTINAQIEQARAHLATAMLAQIQKPDLDDAQNDAQVAAPKIPLPRSRPPESKLMASYGSSDVEPRQPAPTAQSDVRSALQKVFAMLQPSGFALASATPDGGISGDGQDRPSGLAAYDKQTAVYDINARTVYMPDGTKLEAHSGLGDLLDDPRHVAVRDRGATPPNLYELSLREKRFHGVQAIRMKPVGGGDLFGRSGLLAHNYLMGPNGDSNGCVSFKDYDAFLKAFLSGDVKRLVVVKSISNDATGEAGKA
jgi:hypothetical protein